MRGQAHMHKWNIWKRQYRNARQFTPFILLLHLVLIGKCGKTPSYEEIGEALTIGVLKVERSAAAASQCPHVPLPQLAMLCHTRLNFWNCCSPQHSRIHIKRISKARVTQWGSESNRIKFHLYFVKRPKRLIQLASSFKPMSNHDNCYSIYTELVG